MGVTDGFSLQVLPPSANAQHLDAWGRHLPATKSHSPTDKEQPPPTEYTLSEVEANSKVQEFMLKGKSKTHSLTSLDRSSTWLS